MGSRSIPQVVGLFTFATVVSVALIYLINAESKARKANNGFEPSGSSGSPLDELFFPLNTEKASSTTDQKTNALVNGTKQLGNFLRRGSSWIYHRFLLGANRLLHHSVEKSDENNLTQHIRTKEKRLSEEIETNEKREAVPPDKINNLREILPTQKSIVKVSVVELLPPDLIINKQGEKGVKRDSLNLIGNQREIAKALKVETFTSLSLPEWIRMLQEKEGQGDNQEIAVDKDVETLQQPILMHKEEVGIPVENPDTFFEKGNSSIWLDSDEEVRQRPLKWKRKKRSAAISIEEEVEQDRPVEPTEPTQIMKHNRIRHSSGKKKARANYELSIKMKQEEKELEEEKTRLGNEVRDYETKSHLNNTLKVDTKSGILVKAEQESERDLSSKSVGVSETIKSSLGPVETKSENARQLEIDVNKSNNHIYSNKNNSSDSFVLVNNEIICYRTDDVLLVVALTCILNFTFVLVIWAFVRWFSRKYTRQKYYCPSCRKCINCDQQDDQFLLLSEEYSSEEEDDDEDSESESDTKEFYNNRKNKTVFKRRFNSLEDLRYYYT